MKTVFHIGNPKAWSTSIQDMLSREQGDDFRYLGFSPGPDKSRWYPDRTIAALLNFDLRYCNAPHFSGRENIYRVYFRSVIRECEKAGQDLWLSSENVSTRFIPADIEPVGKLERIQAILPAGIEFIVIFRNIHASLKSIYTEYVKQGYTLCFDGFCDEVYLYRESNFLYSLFPGFTLNTLSSFLHQGNSIRVHILSADPGTRENGLLDFLSGFRTSGRFSTLDRHNPSPDGAFTLALLNLNRQDPVPRDAMGLAENHRAFWHLNHEESDRFEEYIWGKLRQQKSNRDDAAGVSRGEGESLVVRGPLRDFIGAYREEDRKRMKDLNEYSGSDYEWLWENEGGDV